MFCRRFHKLGHNYADMHHYIHLYEKMNNIGGGKNQSNTYSGKSVRILSFSGPYLFVFSPNGGKYGLEKLRTQTLSMQWQSLNTYTDKHRYFFKTIG